MILFLAGCIFLAGLFIGVEFVATHQSDGHDSGPRHLRRQRGKLSGSGQDASTATGSSSFLASSNVNSMPVVQHVSQNVLAAKAKSAQLLDGALKQQDKLQKAYEQLQQVQNDKNEKIAAAVKRAAAPKALPRKEQRTLQKPAVLARAASASAAAVGKKATAAGKPAPGDSVQLIGDHHIVVNGAAMDRGKAQASLDVDVGSAADIGVEAW